MKNRNEQEIDFTEQIVANKENKTLNKPFRTPDGPKKFSVYVKNEKGNVVKVNFGDPNMEIKRDDPARRKSFRARHNCSNPGPKWKARYWSCYQWRAGKKVKGSEEEYVWDGETLFDHNELLTINPSLAFVEEEITEECLDCEESEAILTKEQKTLPKALQEKIVKKKIEDKKKGKGEKEEEPEEEDDASLWENIHKKRERIKRGSGEKMRKKGDKGAPTSDQLKRAKSNYEMSLEEYLEVMDVNDLIEAKRPGPKSGAQTPSKPSERKKGSKKNKPGSAGEKGGKITFSESVIKSLKEKVKKHNEKYKKKVTLGQLKKVYRRGAGAFSQSHRPGMTRGGWAMARVNMFLKMVRGGKVKNSYRKADSDIMNS